MFQPGMPVAGAPVSARQRLRSIAARYNCSIPAFSRTPFHFTISPAIWALSFPPRSNRNDPICFSPYLYRARHLVERFFNKIKQCRRVATRYDKLAANYLAFIQLASIRLWLRVNESTP